MYVLSLFYSWSYNILKISLVIVCWHYSHWMDAEIKMHILSTQSLSGSGIPLQREVTLGLSYWLASGSWFLKLWICRHQSNSTAYCSESISPSGTQGSGFLSPGRLDFALAPHQHVWNGMLFTSALMADSSRKKFQQTKYAFCAAWECSSCQPGARNVNHIMFR